MSTRTCNCGQPERTKNGRPLKGGHHATTCPASAAYKAKHTPRCQVCMEPVSKCPCVPCDGGCGFAFPPADNNPMASRKEAERNARYEKRHGHLCGGWRCNNS
jgi:hypothetical protein